MTNIQGTLLALTTGLILVFSNGCSSIVAHDNTLLEDRILSAVTEQISLDDIVDYVGTEPTFMAVGSEEISKLSIAEITNRTGTEYIDLSKTPNTEAIVYWITSDSTLDGKKIAGVIYQRAENADGAVLGDSTNL